MMKSYVCHYMSKYPGAKIDASERSLVVYGVDSSKKVHIEYNGLGVLVDRSEELGCDDRHDSSPIPKEARAWKLYADGRIGKAEEYEERAPYGKALAEKCGGKVPSIEELKVLEKKWAKEAQDAASAVVHVAPQA